MCLVSHVEEADDLKPTVFRLFNVLIKDMIKLIVIQLLQLP